MSILYRIRALVAMFFVDPIEIIYKIVALPIYLRNLFGYNMRKGPTDLPSRLSDIHYSTHDRFRKAGDSKGHYFYQDVWAARIVRRVGGKEHIDVGSRIDGFVAHLLSAEINVKYVDIRPIESNISKLTFVQSSILNLPFETASVKSLSCLHVLEHIGLGRYGDEVDPLGHVKGAIELMRVLGPGGTLLVSTPVGRERLCFDAHRVFNPKTVLELFHRLRLIEFCLVDDVGDKLVIERAFEKAANCHYGCGLYYFKNM